MDSDGPPDVLTDIVSLLVSSDSNTEQIILSQFVLVIIYNIIAINENIPSTSARKDVLRQHPKLRNV